MSTNIEKKITKFIDTHKPGTVILASWLESMGISHELQKRYKRSGWIQSIGTGAYKRPNDTISWEGALYSMQSQSCMSSIHAGGLTALSKQGLSHYIRHNQENVYLFSLPKKTLPAWFKNYNWQQQIEYIRTSMLPDKVELTAFNEKNFTIEISSAERAILESLYLAPEKMDIVECYQILEGLVNLRPKVLQNLLENCSSVKVKRLFLYMSHKIGHQWFDFLDQAKIDLGKGHRSISKGGVYLASYNMTLPEELVKL
ncbi:MAG: hypothetical protein A2287_06480 [Candidatus Melainabacteria bacterium RIFOXYA12_FULL_32_12]|nr:MAG: hypothetical protein A2255_04675 [Candidatus Melainabacteria bacterium RIFOXYA2_FULL_32_9]OGI26326.1 MAG: hypothetical protein A2287_06480 [Candidatus Melainabacteria bacterium RIFOXYA12_FULL_32_12]